MASRSEGEQSAASPRRFGSPNVDLLGALLLVVALNLPQLQRQIVPINDTLYNFANFQIFYSEFLFHGELARWYPYGTYGLQADYEQIASLGPLSYLAGALGALFRVTDAALLFKLAAVGEQMLFVFGIWRLARFLFTRRVTVQVLCVAAAGTTVWYAQQWWDLRIYALLPLLLSFLFRFIESRRPAQLWLAGLTGIVWTLGSLPYWIPVWVLTLATVGGVAVRDWTATLRSLVQQRRSDWLVLAAFLLAAAAYAWFVLHALDGTVLHAIDRDPLTGKVDLENFRSYGGNANLVIVANALLFGWPLHLPWGSGADNSVYLGLVPMLGLAIAVVHERSRNFLALIAGVLVLVWLSMGGVFTAFAYHLPGFAYFRHVGLTFGIVKVLLLVASGYGLDRVFAKGVPRLATPLAWAVVGMLAIELLVAAPVLFGPKPWSWVTNWGSHLMVRLGIYGGLLAMATSFRVSRQAALIAALVLDLSLYQLAVYQTRIPKMREAALLPATAARAVSYQAERSDAPTTPESQRALDLASKTGSRELYWYVYQFAHVDPCRGKWRTDYYQAGVDRLLGFDRASGGNQDPLLGCGVPKLRVVADAQIASSPDDARDRLRDAIGAGDRQPTVIQLVAGAEPPRTEHVEGGAPGAAVVQRFTLDELVASVDVETAGGAWLVYDDAYHPSWRATVDGVEVPVQVANLAWKAVRVPHGHSTVRFWFRHGANYVLGPAIALFGLAAGAALVAWMLRSIARPTRRGASPA